MRRSLITIFALLAFCPASAFGKIVEEHITYDHAGKELEGFLAYDDSLPGPLPGVIVVHEWRGLDDHAMDSARRLAALGYAGFAIDMYGPDILATSPEEAAKLSKPFRDDRALMCARAGAGLKALKTSGRVDPRRIAAIGYCFGGTTVLEMVRGELPIAGAVSFHGGLSSPRKVETPPCPVLVLHGADDPHVPPEEARAFREEMREAKADWQMVYFGGAVHSFTNPNSGNDPSKGVAYDEDAARRSWSYMKIFLQEVLDK